MKNNNIVNVPYILYEKEMVHKSSIIKMLMGIIFALVITLALTSFMFMSFINSHDYTSYDQDGNGQNNINKGTQGDVINESTIERND